MDAGRIRNCLEIGAALGWWRHGRKRFPGSGEAPILASSVDKCRLLAQM
jgi:hypothetical protein